MHITYHSTSPLLVSLELDVIAVNYSQHKLLQHHLASLLKQNSSKYVTTNNCTSLFK